MDESEPKDLMVLGAIKRGAKKFDDIQKMTQIKPKELNSILEQLEDKKLIQVQERKGWLGTKIEIATTKAGDDEVDARIHELQTRWEQMSVLYKTGDKEKLKQRLDDNKSFLPTMMFFGIMDMVMFSMMFGMMGVAMSDYIPTESMPDGGNDGQDAGDGGVSDGGFDFDIGF